MKNLETKFITWLVISSADPDRVAMTVKGALIAVIPTLVVFSQMMHWNWSNENLTLTVEAIASIVSAVLVVVGMVRKLYYLFRPEQIDPTS